MATKFKDPFIELNNRRKPHLIVLVTADDMRREHDEALRKGPGHPGYKNAMCHRISAKNAANYFEDRTFEEFLQETFQALAETRNRHLLTD